MLMACLLKWSRGDETRRIAEEALAAKLSDCELEDALTGEGIVVWGPDGERFARMFEKVMASRLAQIRQTVSSTQPEMRSSAD